MESRIEIWSSGAGVTCNSEPLYIGAGTELGSSAGMGHTLNAQSFLQPPSFSFYKLLRLICGLLCDQLCRIFLEDANKKNAYCAVVARMFTKCLLVPFIPGNNLTLLFMFGFPFSVNC